MFTLNRFSLASMILCCERLRDIALKCRDFEDAAEKIVDFLHDHFTLDDNTQPGCPLIRFYRTTNLAGIPLELHPLARMTLGQKTAGPGTRFLNLVASRGALPDWNGPENSKGHRIIPLISRDQINQLPMVAQLIRQLGLDSQDVINPHPDLLLDLDQRSYGVFYVEDALDSPNIPRQNDFVIPYNIHSVLGFGGMMPSGEMFAILLFSALTIPRETADLFRTIAINIKLALLPYVKKAINQQEPLADAVIRIKESRLNTLNQLLQVFEKTALKHTQILELEHQELLNRYQSLLEQTPAS